MYLFYRNFGDRRYGQEPIQPYPRGMWEFQFFLTGECDLLLRKNSSVKAERLIAPVLVISGPDCAHGWGGKATDACQNMILHFDEAEYPVRTIVGQGGCRKIPFSPAEIPGLQLLYKRCGEARKTLGTTPVEEQRRAGFLEPLIYKIIAAELTLFFLKHIPRAEWGTPQNYGASKISRALAWYEANISRGPNIADVARAVHLSPTHLRRLFHKIRGTSPQKAFTHVQFERAKWLMRDPEMTLERISEDAGFGSASAFSRAFKSEFGVSPKDFRAKQRKR